jgi:Domain of unknown function (DUF4282)
MSIPGQNPYAQHLPPNYPGPHAHPLYTVRPDADPNPFAAAFDFSFETYATPGLVKIVYGGIVVVTILGYLASVIGTFLATLPDHYVLYATIPGSPIPGLAVLLLGWIPALLLILAARLALEQALATVRTAMDARILRDRSTRQP